MCDNVYSRPALRFQPVVCRAALLNSTSLFPLKSGADSSCHVPVFVLPALGAIDHLWPKASVCVCARACIRTYGRKPVCVGVSVHVRVRPHVRARVQYASSARCTTYLQHRVEEVAPCVGC